MNELAIGIDIGGTNTDIGLVNPDGKVLQRKGLKTQEYDDPKLYVRDMAEAIRALMSENGISEIAGVGIGAPNANFDSGCIGANTANLRMKQEIPMCDMLIDQLHVPVTLSNDADAAALGEHIYGGAKLMQHFVTITLGTGVGSGIFVDGHLIHGHGCMAGELGHAIVNPLSDRLCSCGRKGCLEMYASARGICQTYREEAAKGEIPDTFKGVELTCKDVGEMAVAGDPLAIKTYDTTAYWLAIGMANAASFCSPEAFFLMGGPTRAGEALLTPLRRYFAENLLYIYKDKISIRLSQLQANDAAVLGAAALIHLK
jgi:glucokinase